MLWIKPLLYYLMGNSSYTVGLHSFSPNQLERNTELSINLPHFSMDGQPRWKRSAERSTTLSADEFAKSVTGYIATMTPADARAAAYDIHAQWLGRAQNVETELKGDLTNTKKVLNKIGVIDHYRVIIERFHWNYCSMDSNISAKAKKIKNLRDDSIPPNLIWDRENAKEENNEKKLQKAYDNIASFNRRYQMTVATIKHSEDPHVAVFVTQLEKELKRKLSAHEIGLLVASFYSGLSHQIDHNDDLKDDINWEDEEAIKTALKSWKFDGEILDLAIAFHRFNNEI